MPITFTVEPADSEDRIDISRPLLGQHLRCMVGGTWFSSDGTSWSSMAPDLQPATSSVLGGVTIAEDGTISVAPYTLPDDVAKTDVAQTWTSTQTFAGAAVSGTLSVGGNNIKPDQPHERTRDAQC